MASADDLAEIARSASEASKIRLREVDLTRYQNPPANSYYPLEYAFHLLGDVKDEVVVDLGCGSGEELIPLRRRGARVIGIDISPHLIAIALERLQMYGMEAELEVASAYETHLPDASVDVVFCMSLLHHLELERVRNEIRRILKPDGLFILKEPIRLSWTMKQIVKPLRRLLPSDDVSDFEYPLSSAQLNAMAEGFEVLASRSFSTPMVPLLTPIVRDPHLRELIWSQDDRMLRWFPVLAHFATVRVAALRLKSHDQSAPGRAAVA